MYINIHTIFMQLSSLNVLGRSVAMSIAMISTAWLSNLRLLTKSSLQTMAAALPSDVGLHKGQENQRQ
jgi:hypothetical protein